MSVYETIKKVYQNALMDVDVIKSMDKNPFSAAKVFTDFKQIPDAVHDALMNGYYELERLYQEFECDNAGIGNSLFARECFLYLDQLLQESNWHWDKKAMFVAHVCALSFYRAVINFKPELEYRYLASLESYYNSVLEQIRYYDCIGV